MLIFDQSLNDCLKAPTRVMNRMYKGMGGSSKADDEEKQSTKGACHKKTPFVGKKNVSTSNNSSFSLINSFKALNVENPVIEEVEMEGTCVLVDDVGKPMENVDYSGNQSSKDEVESVDNDMASYLASKRLRVGYGTKNLLEQWRETYVNQNYNPYNDDMYKG
ncbi:hypothetical protein Tco_0223122 [Tanacetum coccineum]